jgi:hypothetical protein
MDGRCVTCGRRHPRPFLTAWAEAGAVKVSAWGRRLNLYAAPGYTAAGVDPDAADALLAAAGYARDGEWIAMSGVCRAAHLTALPAAVLPPGDEWTVHLPLTGAEGPLVTGWYTSGNGERHTAEVTYPDGSRCHVRLARRQLSWADQQVWDYGNRARYQLQDWYCPGHGGSSVCAYGMCDEVRYTGPLTEQEGNRTDG